MIDPLALSEQASSVGRRLIAVPDWSDLSWMLGPGEKLVVVLTCLWVRQAYVPSVEDELAALIEYFTTGYAVDIEAYAMPDTVLLELPHVE